MSCSDRIYPRFSFIPHDPARYDPNPCVIFGRQVHHALSIFAPSRAGDSVYMFRPQYQRCRFLWSVRGSIVYPSDTDLSCTADMVDQSLDDVRLDAEVVQPGYEGTPQVVKHPGRYRL